MNPDKRQEFLNWYQDQVRRNVEYNLCQEMEEYCISDVKLLKTGCQKFFKKNFLKRRNLILWNNVSRL